MSFLRQSTRFSLRSSARFSTATARLPRKQFGSTDLLLTSPGLGGVGIGGSTQDSLYGGVSDLEAVETVHTALGRGINWIDTSPLYQVPCLACA